MKDYKCVVYDTDKFTKELILSFIEKTGGLSSIEISEEADIVFVDAALFDGDYMNGLKADTKIVVISSNQQYVHSYFQKKIADYFNKSEISYKRFLDSIEKIKLANV